MNEGPLIRVIVLQLSYNFSCGICNRGYVRGSDMGIDAERAFFSYSRKDSDFALRLAADLKAASAVVWLDQLDIKPGQRWDRAVEDALTTSPIMLVILSPSSVSSQNVQDEVALALEKQKTLIPLLYRDCAVPFRLRRFQYVEFRQDYERGLQQLIKALGVEQQDGRPLPGTTNIKEPVSEQARLELKREQQTAERARSKEAAAQKATADRADHERPDRDHEEREQREERAAIEREPAQGRATQQHPPDPSTKPAGLAYETEQTAPGKTAIPSGMPGEGPPKLKLPTMVGAIGAMVILIGLVAFFQLKRANDDPQLNTKTASPTAISGSYSAGSERPDKSSYSPSTPLPRKILPGSRSDVLGSAGQILEEGRRKKPTATAVAPNSKQTSVAVAPSPPRPPSTRSTKARAVPKPEASVPVDNHAPQASKEGTDRRINGDMEAARAPIITPSSQGPATTEAGTGSMIAALGLAVYASPLTQQQEYARAFGTEGVPGGLVVSGVEAGSDAAVRGLRAGDVILSVQSGWVDTPRDLEREVEVARAIKDQELRLEVLRGATVQTVTVRISSM